jgi:hypothetical protein
LKANQASLDTNKAALDATELQTQLATKTESLTTALLDESHLQAKLATEMENLTKALAKDSSSMKIIAILTALFLPGTFMAVSPPLSS